MEANRTFFFVLAAPVPREISGTEVSVSLCACILGTLLWALLSPLMMNLN